MSDKNTDPGNWKKPAWLEKLSGFHMSKRAMVITVIIIAVATVFKGYEHGLCECRMGEKGRQHIHMHNLQKK